MAGFGDLPNVRLRAIRWALPALGLTCFSSAAPAQAAAYVLGDSPLVLLTALLGGYDPRPTSSRWVDRPRPRLLDTGEYGDPVDGAPPLRIFTHLDVRLLLEDLYAKLSLHAIGT